jgi:hypothetical protein
MSVRVTIRGVVVATGILSSAGLVKSVAAARWFLQEPWSHRRSSLLPLKSTGVAMVAEALQSRLV